MRYLIGGAKELRLARLLRRILNGQLTCVLQIHRENDSCRLIFISGALFVSPQDDLPAGLVGFSAVERSRAGIREAAPYGLPEVSREVTWLIAEWLREGEIQWYRMDDVPATLTRDLIGPFPTDVVATQFETFDSSTRPVPVPTVQPPAEKDADERPSVSPAADSRGPKTLKGPGWQRGNRLADNQDDSRVRKTTDWLDDFRQDAGREPDHDSSIEAPSYSIEPELLWQRHFGMYRDPFSLTPDPEFLYLSEAHQEALAGLKLSLMERRGLTVMTGEVGTGKTTLLYSMLSELEGKVETAYLYNTTLTFDELLEGTLQDLGVAVAQSTRLGRLNALNGFLDLARERGRTVALVIDEAQNLSGSAFEGLRLLLNFETYQSKLLQIILVGQPELGRRLLAPNLRQIADRVAVRCHLRALTEPESHEYLSHRLRLAGAEDSVITPAARRFVVRKAKGVPRRINVLCHNGFLFAYGRGERRVAKNLMKAADRELRMTPRSRLPSPRRLWSREG